jgi:hypothetical protein
MLRAAPKTDGPQCTRVTEEPADPRDTDGGGLRMCWLDLQKSMLFDPASRPAEMHVSAKISTVVKKVLSLERTWCEV